MGAVKMGEAAADMALYASEADELTMADVNPTGVDARTLDEGASDGGREAAMDVVAGSRVARRLTWS